MLSISTRMTLKPWFSDATLSAAGRWLQEGGLPQLLFYRQGCASLFAGQEGHCLIIFEPAPRIVQKFRPAKVTCSLCSARQKASDHCIHAAMTIASVLVNLQRSSIPSPLDFEQSQWRDIGRFLSQAGQGRPKITQTDANLTVANNVCTMELPNNSAGLGLSPSLFSDQAAPQADQPPTADHHQVQEAWSHLHQELRTKTETELNKHGRQSKGQETDTSLWMQVCHNLHLLAPSPSWELERLADNTFTLKAMTGAESCLVRCQPSRAQTLGLIRQSGNQELITMAPEARAYSKISFQGEEGALWVEPWLELADGRKIKRSELDNYAFGDDYSLEGTTFFPIREQKEKFIQSQASNMPLFAFMEQSSGHQSGRIPPEKVPAFLDKHQGAIHSGEHDIDPNLADLTITDLPDSLEISDYQEDGDWCYLCASYRFGSRKIELAEILKLRSEGKCHATGTEKWLQLADTPLDWIYDQEKERRVEKDGKEYLKLTRLEMLSLTSMVPEHTEPDHTAARSTLTSRLNCLSNSTLNDTDAPAHLRLYQRTGLAWLHHLWENGLGGILADDMGLGKTHQALALLQLSARLGNKAALVVCPASVLSHWQDKVDNFYPELTVTVHHGPDRGRIDKNTPGIILTTYGVLRQDIHFLWELDLPMVIFDEMQHLKNKKSATAKAAAQLQAGACFGLTGTPLENSLADLKSLFDLCTPGLLGSDASFKRTYQTPIEEGGNRMRQEALRRLTSPFMLRRLRSQVLQELPEVIEDIRYCGLSSDQVDLYGQLVEQQGGKLLASMKENEEKGNHQLPYMGVLALIQQLKQVCNHPAQFAKNKDYGRYDSGKWELFVEILEECLDAGLKVVVFSQYTGMLDIIETYLADRQIPFGGFRGSTVLAKRQKMIDGFNNDSKMRVFCVSLLAGGSGIDLTGAQAVIHYDRWWNAAKEEQATARVHRLGQKQAVQVFKFVTTGTLEEKIHRLIGMKTDLSDELVQADDQSLIKRLSREEIMKILRWSPAE